MMTGPFINSAGIIAGTLFGASCGRYIPARLKERMPLVFGIIAMGLGAVMIVKVKQLPPVTISLLIGTILGELIRLEDGVQKLASKTRALMERMLPSPDNGMGHEEFLESFVSMLVLFCVSGMGIFGSMNEGMTGDFSMLLVKALLDCFTAAIFAISLGYTLALAALPQFLVQAALFFGATLIMPLTSDVMIADFSAVGGFIMLATGFRICKLVPFAVANMVPSLFLIFPLSALWSRIAF